MDIDDVIKDDEEEQERSAPSTARKPLESIKYDKDDVDTEDTEYSEEDTESNKTPSNKSLVGTVELFFSKINVAAIRLTGSLKLGDIIEIENEGRAIKFVVSSIQINKKNVTEASAGDSVGIKVSTQVKAGSDVYIVRI